ncbi:MAG TPA: N-acetyltransferase [Ktedonobacterales bacterium]|nr:N-acetyltransferase [Ktedonobacterales bacterium]
MTTVSERPISVRLATDADRIAARTSIPSATARGRASLALLKTGQGLLWVAVEGTGDEEEMLVGLLLATAQVQPEREELVGYIHELLVHPASRRRGVAMHLLDAAEHFFLEEHAFANVELTTSPDNEAALQLYRSRGYTISSVRFSKQRGLPPTEEC